jgi:hypothetical protein
VADNDVFADAPSAWEHAKIDTSVAHPARVYNYWLGGKDNYAADREAGNQAIAVLPGFVAGIRHNREFLARAVRRLVTEAGIRQFLDIGTGLPSANNTHEVAQAIAPEARIVYVDNDPIVLVHARALLTSTPAGATAYIEADLRDPEKILREAAATLDFSQPVAVMLLAILQFVPDSAGPHGIVTQLLDVMPSGSHLVITHPAIDVESVKVGDVMTRLNERTPRSPATFRTHAEVSRFFQGLAMVEPGLVQVHRWHSGPGAPIHLECANWAGIGRKP